MRRRTFKKAVLIGTVGISALALMGFVVMSLWNWLAPEVFGLHAITYWQAFGLLVLSKILFGGFRGRPRCGGHWRRRMMERWQQMTPDEREKFRQGLFRGCGLKPEGLHVEPQTGGSR
jgi:hypothetical protein